MDKMKKTKLGTLIVCVLFVSLMIIMGFCDYTYRSRYSISIVSNDGAEFTIQVPLPLLDGDSSGLVDSLIPVAGNGSYHTVTTEHGLALEISGSGNLTIISTGEKSWTKWYGKMSDDITKFDLDAVSLPNFTGYSTSPSYFINSSIEETNLTIEIEIYEYSSWNYIMKLSGRIGSSASSKKIQIDGIIQGGGWKILDAKIWEEDT